MVYRKIILLLIFLGSFLGTVSCSFRKTGGDFAPVPKEVFADSAQSAQAELRAKSLLSRVDSLPPAWKNHPGVQEKSEHLLGQLRGMQGGLTRRKADPATAQTTMDWMESWVAFLERVHPDSIVEEAGEVIGTSQVQVSEIKPSWERTDPCDVRDMEPFDFRMLHHCTDSLARSGAWSQAAQLLENQIRIRNRTVDVAERTLLLANLYHYQGNARNASRVLEPFLAYKPALLELLDSAARLDLVLQESLRQGHISGQALSLQIVNLNAAGAEWEHVRALVDSLKGQSPTDSVVRWAGVQDSLAWMRTVQRGQQKILELRQVVQTRADFVEAEKIMEALRSRHPALVKQWNLEEVQSWLNAQRTEVQQVQPAADPRAALIEARRLMERRQFFEARDLYRSILPTNLRKEAQEDLDLLSEAWCNERRKEAADKFAASRKAGVSESRQRTLLQEGVTALDRCLQEFPGVSFADRVEQNRKLLQNQLLRMQEVSP